MADKQIGNEAGVASATGDPWSSVENLAAVTADGANTVTVDDVTLLRVGMMIDLVDPATGVPIASRRSITAINTGTKVVTYGGADVAATGSHRVRHSPVSNDLSIAGLRERLTAFDANTYSAAQLNKMTYNDLVYASRMIERSPSVR